MKRIRVLEEYCIGCRLCEIHCQVQHSNSKRLIKAFKEERDTLQPRVTVEQFEYHTFALQCRHCEDAPCLEACMTGALYRDSETGAILCDEDKCVGCWMCIMVCPVGAIKQRVEGNIASKCDLCIGEEVPVCVENCPNEALVLEEYDE